MRKILMPLLFLILIATTVSAGNCNKNCNTNVDGVLECTCTGDCASVTGCDICDNCGNDIPEFTSIGAAIALVGAGYFALRKRK